MFSFLVLVDLWVKMAILVVGGFFFFGGCRGLFKFILLIGGIVDFVISVMYGDYQLVSGLAFMIVFNGVGYINVLFQVIDMMIFWLCWQLLGEIGF